MNKKKQKSSGSGSFRAVSSPAGGGIISLQESEVVPVKEEDDEEEETDPARTGSRRKEGGTDESAAAAPALSVRTPPEPPAPGCIRVLTPSEIMRTLPSMSNINGLHHHQQGNQTQQKNECPSPLPVGQQLAGTVSLSCPPHFDLPSRDERKFFLLDLWMDWMDCWMDFLFIDGFASFLSFSLIL